MAYNNWDKLSKAQRDYPKPKFAVGVVDKALKKNPKNPFLTAWKADLSLKLTNEFSEDVVIRLNEVCSQPGLSDPRLLSYLYKLCAEATRRTQSFGHSAITIGNEWLKPWQSAAKALNRKGDRLDLWNTLFLAAMREDLWEDVRFAVVNYCNESPPSKKNHYTRILVTLNAAQQKCEAMGKPDQMAHIQMAVTRKQMKQAFEAPQDDPFAIKDIRDLRFMAEIYARQDHHNELFALWANPPDHLKGIMKTYKDELSNLASRLLRRQKDWAGLESHCLGIIDDTLASLNLVQDSKSLWELCAWNFKTWQYLMEAMEHTRPRQEAVEKMSMYMDACFGTGAQAKDRPVRLTYMALCRFVGHPILPLCKDYWDNHYALPSCFADLCQYIAELSVKDVTDFYMHMVQLRESLFNPANDKVSHKDRQQAQLNVLKLEYLMCISKPVIPTYAGLETNILNATQFLALTPESSDAGFVAIYSLLRLHHQIICGEADRMPFEVTVNSRILLQASMLARHLVARDKNKENRTFALLAARLHLNLGLGKDAFQLYQHAKCKEMLLDTLSPYILSRISMTHPFEVKGYQGFSADEELAKVVSTIERMENKTDAYIFNDMPNFISDQVTDALDLKRRLKSSLTKHLCTAERRRMARLKGESTENIPLSDHEVYHNLEDNVDRSVFPNYEEAPFPGPLAFVMPNAIPFKAWLYASDLEINNPSRVLYQEAGLWDFDEWKSKVEAYQEGIHDVPSCKTKAEVSIQALWALINIFTFHIKHPKVLTTDLFDPATLVAEIHRIRKAMEKLRMPGGTGLKPEDEPTMFHENMLMSCYTKLEALRAIAKLVGFIRDISGAKVTHPLKKKIPAGYPDELWNETLVCFEALRDVARSYLTLLAARGVVAIRAQVRWGETGSVLRALLSDEDVEFYAKGYVESAVEAWNGVLRVKL